MATRLQQCNSGGCKMSSQLQWWKKSTINMHSLSMHYTFMPHAISSYSCTCQLASLLCCLSAQVQHATMRREQGKYSAVCSWTQELINIDRHTNSKNSTCSPKISLSVASQLAHFHCTNVLQPDLFFIYIYPHHVWVSAMQSAKLILWAEVVLFSV